MSFKLSLSLSNSDNVFSGYGCYGATFKFQLYNFVTYAQQGCFPQIFRCLCIETTDMIDMKFDTAQQTRSLTICIYHGISHFEVL